MGLTKFIFPVVAVLCLSSCANTFNGIKEDAVSIKDASRSEAEALRYHRSIYQPHGYKPTPYPMLKAVTPYEAAVDQRTEDAIKRAQTTQVTTTTQVAVPQYDSMTPLAAPEAIPAPPAVAAPVALTAPEMAAMPVTTTTTTTTVTQPTLSEFPENSTSPATDTENTALVPGGAVVKPPRILYTPSTPIGNEGKQSMNTGAPAGNGLSGGQGAPQWNILPEYNGNLPVRMAAAPAATSPYPGAGRGAVRSEGVTVFPIEGGSDIPYVQPSYESYNASPSNLTLAVADNYYGQLVKTIFFKDGAVNLAAADKKELAQLAQGLKRTMNDIAVTVVGHASKPHTTTADIVKTKMANVQMAQKRADAVSGMLRKNGVSADHLTTVSKGDDVPNAEPGDMRQEDADRRVEIYVENI